MDIKNYTGRRKFIMKNKLQAELMIATGKIIKKVVDKEQNKWIPHCMGILHQPKRPTHKIQ